MENLRRSALPTTRAAATETSRPLDRLKDREARLALDVAGVTHPGRRRLNQDQHVIADLAAARRHHAESGPPRVQASRVQASDETLLAVADGMGGHPGGEIASLLAVRVLIKELLDAPGETGDSLERLGLALRRCDAALHETGARRTDLATMGTTLTAAWWIPPVLYFAHVGDSRLYLLRDGMLSRLTRDHSLPAALAAAGHVCGNSSGIGHILTQAVGGAETGIDPELGAERLVPGDVLLLCSDGLVRGVSDEEIERVLTRAESAREATSALLVGALASDDGDNITAVVARLGRARARSAMVGRA